MSNLPDNVQPEIPERIVFHYLKSPMFRTIHADGMYGGVTPNAKIHIAFFSERNPIPQQVEYSVNPTGQLGDEILDSRVVRDGLVREVDVDVILDLETAVSFRKWIDEKIQLLQGGKVQK